MTTPFGTRIKVETMESLGKYSKDFNMSKAQIVEEALLLYFVFLDELTTAKIGFAKKQIIGYVKENRSSIFGKDS